MCIFLREVELMPRCPTYAPMTPTETVAASAKGLLHMPLLREPSRIGRFSNGHFGDYRTSSTIHPAGALGLITQLPLRNFPSQRRRRSCFLQCRCRFQSTKKTSKNQQGLSLGDARVGISRHPCPQTLSFVLERSALVLLLQTRHNAQGHAPASAQ